MTIRIATLKDSPAISGLLTQLGYPGTEAFMEQKIKQMEKDSAAELLVYEESEEVLAFISLHFIPQIALEGDFMRISYFAVDESARSKGIGRELEQFSERIARERGCSRIEVHCHSRRVDAHRFYARQGFEESPKYFSKPL